MPNEQQVNEITEIEQALMRLVRGERTDLASLLYDVEVHTELDGTRVTFHCHCLRLDGNGRPRVTDLVAAICDYTLDFAIPRSAIAEALSEASRTGSTRALVHLGTEARSLFTHITNTGEGGELLLFILAETVLKLPQLLCKMDLKTNSSMHVHGADGLHVAADPTSGHLLLYWGESKLFANPSDAIRECFKSIAPMLNSTGQAGAGVRDLHLLSRHADLADEQLEAAIKKYLNPHDPHFNQLEFCGLCMVGFNSEAYATSVSGASFDGVLAQLIQQLPSLKNAVVRRVGAESLVGFGFHTICVPFPSVDVFRTQLISMLGLNNVPS